VVFSTRLLAPVYLAVMIGAASLTWLDGSGPYGSAGPATLAAMAAGAGAVAGTILATGATGADTPAHSSP
jgi:hypothetical protein